MYQISVMVPAQRVQILLYRQVRSAAKQAMFVMLAITAMVSHLIVLQILYFLPPMNADHQVLFAVRPNTAMERTRVAQWIST